MKVLVTGAEGQLGRDLARVMAHSADLLPCGRDRLDVTDADAVFRLIRNEKPDAIIHAAAYTQVDRAESEPDEVFRINALGARNVAAAAAEIGCKLAYVSTDYVFDGTSSRPYREFDRTCPLSVYGHSKLEGERFVQRLNGKSFIVRTSWLYGRGPNNFVGKILLAARAGKPLKVVSDEIGSPTYTEDLAVFLAGLVRTNLYGVYHAANTGSCSRLELARAALDLSGMADVPIEPISSSELRQPAPRPRYSVLDDWMIRLNGLEPMPDWRNALTRCLAGH